MPSKLAEEVEALGLNFLEVQPGAGTEPVPLDWYWVEVAKWQETRTSGDSAYPGALMYRAQLIIKDGAHKNRRLFESFMLAGQMAEQNLGRMRGLAVSCGIPKEVVMSNDWDPNDQWGEKNLVGRNCDARVIQQPAKGDYEAGNRVMKYRPHEYTTNDMLED